MASQAFVDSLVKEIVEPGVGQLLDLPYFRELRAGKLSIKRLQGWALQHYLHNVALLKGFDASRVHQALLHQFADALDIDAAPIAARLARGKADFVALVINRPADAVNPAVTERLIDRFRPGDAGPASAFFVKADLNFGSFVMVLRQPCAPVNGRRKE